MIELGPLEKMTFGDLVDYYWGNMVIEIGKGQGRSAMFLAMEMATRWKESQAKKEAEITARLRGEGKHE